MSNLLDPDITSSKHTLQGNNPLVLSYNAVWLVKSGTVAVFAVATLNGVSQGGRRYLFDVEPGSVLFGISPTVEGQSYELIAVAYEETQLLEVDLQQIIYQDDSVSKQTLTEISELVEQWTERCIALFHNTNIAFSSIDSTEIKTPAILLEQLQQFQAEFLVCLHQLHQQEEEAREVQFHHRLKLNQQASDRSIGYLTAIFRPQAAEFLQEGTNLLVAAGSVGRALGIDIRPPASSEDLNRVKDPLEAIARASRIRTRRVILSGMWWKFDCGPLLAYTAETENPIALLPVGSNGYEIFDPEARRRLPLNAQTAQLISPVAFMFYRPFPEKALKALDIVKFATRGRTRDIITLVVMGVVTALLEMLVPQATGILIDHAIPDANRGLIFQIALGLMAVALGSIGFELIQSIATSRLGTFANIETQTAVWDRLLKLQVSFFRQYSIGDLQSRVSSITRINQILSGAVLGTIFNAFFSVLNLGLLFSYSPQLTLIAVIVAVVNIIVTNIAGVLSRQKMVPMQEIQGEIFGLTVQLIGGVSKLYVSGAEERAFAYWSKKFSQELQLMLSTEAIENAITFFNSILPGMSSIVIYFVTISLITQSTAQGGAVAFTTGNFLAFNAAFATFVGGATSFSNSIIQVSEVSVLWERAKPILEAPPEVDDSKTDPGRLSGGVKLDRVSFRYRADGPLTLDKVTIEAKPGEFIAVVGPSGSGKSTTVRLLLGFEEPEEGTIYYDGQDLSGLDVAAVRRQLGVVLQNGRISSASIFENISSGALVTMDEVWEAAKMAGFAPDIQQMPMGMHTVISEGGTNLSGGQRQRLLIARSLVLKPKILIFDEATSALDNNTQAIVSESLEQLNVTRIVIAHRLSTIRNADRIYVIAAGQVMQVGNFEELMAQKGIFIELMSRQMV
ncbi:MULTISPECIES: NHLP bacteriocin export ABC transporter permease/ATPase subunit [unclassified Tolypothrix]|uniref:NHLP bacteriocin export ABC transporter permease/ATPase subunit n=1 Tax=unclassified Tolypothrix TaxID=2649714 RepID=UPI0005EAAD10|nr:MULTISPECIES: NHLP bacteriocin export ABC transporter permease/ATPase subunit [unclassified Tolypothrix]BAY91197.1 ABC transporter-related protein [Microchaete diplosiphon NIES-3275]EKF00025.1 ABC transporter, ATP-binding protein [Tolypothrix sp. PCC 7601]MBE9080842.1 NHLP bacteriocin export ABC transporter permease/ATPase subunit [Tolypothrix sp. LEGE 11397]UYD25280.1 NHLP bacteriocin export ABC transporter permease/ATPase subunit [Tolypothrix sp. PCC 7712]UYD32480.1 NHLP bacteriocin expor